MNLKFYQDLYDAEWKRREQIQAATGTPLTLLVLLGGALLVLIREVRVGSTWPEIVEGASLLVAMLCFVLAVYQLVRAYYGYHYRRLPWPGEIRDYERALRAYHEQESIAHKTEATFDDRMIERLVEAADKNGTINLRRSEYLHRANAAIIATLLFAAITGVPFAIAKRTQETTIQRVEVVRLPEGTMAKESTEKTSTAPADDGKGKLKEPELAPNKDVRTEMKKKSTR